MRRPNGRFWSPAWAVLAVLAAWAMPARANPDKLARIDATLAELQPERAQLRETTRALRLPNGGEVLVAAHRRGPDVRRIVTLAPAGPDEMETSYTWADGALVHVQQRRQRQVGARTVVQEEHRLWLERGRPLQWTHTGRPMPLPDKAADALAARSAAMADSMKRLMQYALPAGRDRCDWTCSDGGTPPCSSFRCR